LFETKVHPSVYNRIEKEILEQIDHFHIRALDYENQVYNQLRNWNSVRDQIQDQIWSELKTKLVKWLKNK